MRFIVIADLHLRKERPRCRLDSDWLETQYNQLVFLFQKANEYDCNILIEGDVFDSPKVDPIVSNMLWKASEVLNPGIKVCARAGNHDLPYHSLNLVEDASIWPFFNFRHPPFDWNLGWAYSFGEEPEDNKFLAVHQLVFKDEKSIPPNSNGISAKTLHEFFPSASWILCGDNHEAFSVHDKGHTWHVINPGSMNRQKADQKDYHPGCYFIDTDRNLIEWIEIPDPVQMVTDEYLLDEKAKEDRIAAFVEKLHESGNVSLSFLDNLRSGLIELDESIQSQVIEILNNAGVKV